MTDIFKNLSKIGTKQQVIEWRNNLFGGKVDYTEDEKLQAWYDRILKQSDKGEAMQKPCKTKKWLFSANFTNLPQSDLVSRYVPFTV